jgi:sugar phosphate isomerase/epimerase
MTDRDPTQPAPANPLLGMALWLLKGGTLPELVRWASEHEFAAVSFYQHVLDVPAAERAEAARIVRDAGLCVTFHANLADRPARPGDLDEPFLDRLCAEVLWWQGETGRVRSCCFDPLHVKGPDDALRFDVPLNRRLVLCAAEHFGSSGVRTGIENSFGAPGCYQSVADVRRFAEACGLPQMGLLLDAGHANIHVQNGGKEAPARIGEFVRALPLEILEVHVTDNRGLKDEHRHLGYGNLDLAALLSALMARGFRGPLTVEVCLDILVKKYQSDIHDPAQMAPILHTRDVLKKAL